MPHLAIKSWALLSATALTATLALSACGPSEVTRTVSSETVTTKEAPMMASPPVTTTTTTDQTYRR